MVVRRGDTLIDLDGFVLVKLDTLGSTRGAKVYLYTAFGKRHTEKFNSDLLARDFFDKCLDLMSAE